MPRRVILTTPLSPGDLCTLTAAIESLHQSYPGHYLTDVRTTCDELFRHNPNVTPLREEKAQSIEMHYTEWIDGCNQAPRAFLGGYCQDLGGKLGVPLELRTHRPHLYLSDEEKTGPPFAQEIAADGRYWLVNAGVKNDFTCKQWPLEYYQEVVNHFRGNVQFVQVGSAEHNHIPLDGVVNLIGRTDTRELIRLAYFAVGGVGPITFLQHLCAAFDKPYVAVLGGREPVSWVQYPLQTTLHTLGKLPCCRTKACWKSRVVPLHDGSEQDKSLCEWPVLDMSQAVSKCMAIIKPVEVIRAIEACHEGGTLPYPGESLLPANDPHRRRLEQVVESTHNYPAGRFAGRGVVLCAGGEKYLTCAYVCVRMLRQLGCALPVQLWHLGEAEMPDRWRAIFTELGIELVNALSLSKTIPCRILNGWEIKCYSLINSRFREVIFLDADNVPVVNPEFLFETAPYRKTGALFWPDRGRLGRDHSIWRLCDIDFRDEPEFETGQIVIDKARCWKALAVAMHFNEWSDFYYRQVHGDKETFHLAWRKVDQPYAMAPPLEDQHGGAIYQHDFEGRKIFQHRNGVKWQLEGENPCIKGFDHHAECIEFLQQLRAGLFARGAAPSS